jgi:hypothetical protein
LKKGLSRLQKKILRMAYRNQRRISARDVLAEVYGFPVAVNLSSAKNGAQVFDRTAIGSKRYQSASVSVCKAFNRLAARGLAQRHYNYGITLTSEGQKVAKELGSLDG